jgi:hypothetical protein
MKYKIYMRVAKTDGRTGYKVSASTRPNNEPINSGTYNTTWYPTVAFAVLIDLPDELFNQAERVIAELNASLKDATVSSEFVLPEGITIKQPKKPKDE